MKYESKNLIKELVRISSVADEQGKFDVADKLVKCAKKVHNKTVLEQDLIDAICGMERSGFSDEAKMIREAYSWEEFKGNVRGLGRGLGKIKTEWQVGGLTEKFKNLVGGVESFKGYLDTLSKELGRNPALKKSIDDLNSSIQIDQNYMKKMVAGIEGNLQQSQGQQVNQQQQINVPAATTPSAAQIPQHLRYKGQQLPLEQENGKFYVNINNQKKEVFQQGGRWQFASVQQAQAVATPENPVNVDEAQRAKVSDGTVTETPAPISPNFSSTVLKKLQVNKKTNRRPEVNDEVSYSAAPGERRNGILKGQRGNMVVVLDSETQQEVDTDPAFVRSVQFQPRR